MKIAVVGSGPSAAAAVRTLLKSGYTVEVLDIGEVYSPGNNDKNLNSTLKSYFGSNFLYDSTFINKDNIIKNVYPSRSYGGYSLVWGATINGERENNIIDSQFNFKPNFYVLKKDIKVNENPHSLAVNLKLCNFCGECLKGCSRNAIWDSRIVFSELIDRKAIKYRRDKVLKLVQKKVVELITESGEVLSYDKVLLCCGPIATINILYNSEIITSPVFLNDSQTFFGILLRFPKKLSKHEFALSHKNITIYKDSSVHSVVQLYLDARGLRFRYLPEKYANKNFVRFVFKVLASVCVPFIGYLPEEKSGCIEVCMQKSSISLKSSFAVSFREKFSILLRLFKSFIKIKMILTGIKFLGVGEGYHFGSIHGNNQADNIRLTSRVNNSSDIFIFDACILNKVPNHLFTDEIISEVVARVNKNFPPVNS
jgi:ferredoxin